MFQQPQILQITLEVFCIGGTASHRHQAHILRQNATLTQQLHCIRRKLEVLAFLNGAYI